MARSNGILRFTLTTKCALVLSLAVLRILHAACFPLASLLQIEVSIGILTLFTLLFWNLVLSLVPEVAKLTAITFETRIVEAFDDMLTVDFMSTLVAELRAPSFGADYGRSLQK